MKHPSTNELFRYWNARRGAHAAPERAAIEPSAIRRILADTFILSYDERGGHPFRIAGTRVCAIFGRELKNTTYADLWSGEDRRSALDLLSVVAGEAVGVVASARGAGANDGRHELELLLLPLRHHGRTNVRVLGALAPAGTAPPWVGVSTLPSLSLGTFRYLGDDVRPPTQAPVRPPSGHVRRGFVVYDGGQA